MCFRFSHKSVSTVDYLSENIYGDNLHTFAIKHSLPGFPETVVREMFTGVKIATYGNTK